MRTIPPREANNTKDVTFLAAKMTPCPHLIGVYSSSIVLLIAPQPAMTLLRLHLVLQHHSANVVCMYTEYVFVFVCLCVSLWVCFALILTARKEETALAVILF